MQECLQRQNHSLLAVLLKPSQARRSLYLASFSGGSPVGCLRAPYNQDALPFYVFLFSGRIPRRPGRFFCPSEMAQADPPSPLDGLKGGTMLDLSAPKVITFIASVVLALVAVIIHYAHIKVPITHTGAARHYSSCAKRASIRPHKQKAPLGTGLSLQYGGFQYGSPLIIGARAEPAHGETCQNFARMPCGREGI